MCMGTFTCRMSIFEFKVFNSVYYAVCLVNSVGDTVKLSLIRNNRSTLLQRFRDESQLEAPPCGVVWGSSCRVTVLIRCKRGCRFVASAAVQGNTTLSRRPNANRFNLALPRRVVPAALFRNVAVLPVLHKDSVQHSISHHVDLYILWKSFLHCFSLHRLSMMQDLEYSVTCCPFFRSLMRDSLLQTHGTLSLPSTSSFSQFIFFWNLMQSSHDFSE